MNLQVKNRIRKAVTYVITGFTFLVISAFLILQIPAVQEALVKRYLGNFSTITGFTTSIESFQLLWFDRLELRNLKVTDPEGHEMIGAKTLVVNFKLSQLFQQQDINVDGIFVEGANVYLTKIAESDTSKDLNINVFVNRINETYGSAESTGRTPRFNIGEAVLNDSHFSYVNQDADSVKTGFNYNHFTVDIDEGQLQNFLILGDTTQFHVNTLLAQDHVTKFPIRQLSTFFRLSQQSMEFIDLHVEAGKSVISDTIVFRYNGLRELNDFVTKVNIHANLKNTLILPEDLALFAPDAAKLTKPIYLSGIFNGRVDNFKLTNMEMGIGRTVLKGSVDMEGLPDINETFIILGLKNSKLDFQDFSFLFRDEVLERLTPMGRVNLEGEFLGYPTDFVAKGEFSGNLGRISSDINFKVNEKDFDRSEYSGKLALYGFDLGLYLRDTTNFQKVNLSGNVKGSGLTFQTADFQLNGKINSIGLRKYDYKNIVTNARFASQLFNGYIKVDDPNLQFSAKGAVDLRDGHESIKMQARLDTAFLRNLNLTSQDIFVHSHANIDVRGLHIDSLIGAADLEDFRFHYNDRSLELKEIHLSASRSEGSRILSMKTSLLDADVDGNYLLSDISNDFKRLVHELLLNIKNDKNEISEYYSNRLTSPKPYQANFKIRLQNIDPIVSLFHANASISHETLIEGKFTSGYTSMLQVFSDVDTIRINDAYLIDTDIELNASKIADSTSVLAMASVNSKGQYFNQNFETRDVVAEAIWNRNHIDFGFDADQKGPSNYLRLKGQVDFFKDSTQIRVLPSMLKVLETVWQVDQKNMITIQQEDIKVSQLTLHNNKQYISANGMISHDPEKSISLKVNDFDLSILNSVTGRELTGRLNALFDVTGVYENPYIENDITLDSLTVDKFLIGNIVGKNRWDTLQNRFQMNFEIDRQSTKIISVGGYYQPSLSESPLNLQAKLTNANLRILQPFLEDVFSSIDGTVTGDFVINGTITHPLIDGHGIVEGGLVKMNYLNTTYRFKGKAGLSPTSIYFNDIQLTDEANNHARLDGQILHNNFYGMRINIDASFENFQVLKTTPKDNSLFSGTGYATGDLNIFGPVSNLKISANARTDKNTRIKIPIGDYTEVERKEFIQFVNFNDSTFQQTLVDKIKDKIDLTGITFDLNLDVTPDAFCEIILDQKAGDIIRGTGIGDLQLQYDTKGDFNMFGTFEFIDGWYNFTLYDIVNKQFQIKRGSRISWYGDAYQGILDISAFYNQVTSFAPTILDQDLMKNPPTQLRRKYQARVLLKLDGPMLKPNINFDIVAPDLPQNIVTDDGRAIRLAFEFQAFKNRIDEQELKRQVFSLIMLKRFSPPESFNTSGSIANSVSELLSNQLSNWISQVDENLQVDVDLSTFDAAAFNTFQLRVSYLFLNGRLRITRDGTTFYGQNNNNSGTATVQQQNSLATIAGDWTVEYMLTGDGKLRIKMYNRSNSNPLLNATTTQSAVTAGASLLYTRTFNRLRDLWQTARSKRKDEPDADTDTNDEAIKEEEHGSR